MSTVRWGGASDIPWQWVRFNSDNCEGSAALAEVCALLSVILVVTVTAGAVQHQRLAGQEQGSHPGVRCAAHARVQRTTRLLLL